MKNKNSLWFIVILLAVILVGCGKGKQTISEDETKVPDSAESFKNEHYKDVKTRLEKSGFNNIEFDVIDDLMTGWLISDGDVSKVSIDGITDFQKKDVFLRNAKVVIAYHTYPQKKEDFNDVFPDTSKTSDGLNKDKNEIINIKNNKEFAYIINADDNFDAYEKFAKRYKGRKIEFDGHIAHILKSSNDKSSFDYLIYYGDYNKELLGPPFKFQEKNHSQLNITNDKGVSALKQEKNIHIIAKISEYNSGGDVIILEPIETRFR